MRELSAILGTVVALAGLAGGCAAKTQAAGRANAAISTSTSESAYEDASVAALVFDPPIAQNEPGLELSRESRQPGAFVGYEQLTTTFFYLRTDDRWRTDGLDRYERRAISERVGMSFR
jgi:hypothetical protein